MDVKKSERTALIGFWLARGDRLTVGVIARRLDVPRRYVLRDLDDLERVLPIVKDCSLVRLLGPAEGEEVL